MLVGVMDLGIALVVVGVVLATLSVVLDRADDLAAPSWWRRWFRKQ